MNKTLSFTMLFYLTTASYCFETSADDVQIDTKNGVCCLSGTVVTKINDKTFRADKITIYTKDNKPYKIIAIGNVRYIDKKVEIISQSCVSDMKYVKFLGKVIIEGKGYGKINADMLSYNISSGKVQMAAKKRVKFVLDHKIEKKITKK